jgi:cell division septal protein FtsQ
MRLVPSLTWQKVMPWVSLTVLIISIVVPLALLIWFTFFTDTFTVKAITVVDARPHITQAVRERIEREITPQGDGARPLIFGVRTAGLEHDIVTDIPAIRSVHITRQLPGTIKALVQEKTPALLLLNKGQYYFVDAEGIAYEQASLHLLPGVVLPTVKNRDASVEVSPGKPVLAPEFVSFVKTIETDLPSKVSAEVAEIRVPSLAAREVTFRLSNNWDIRFDTTRRADEQLRILETLLTHNISEEEKATLEYIDLRIPNRVYFKDRRGTTTVDSD